MYEVVRTLVPDPCDTIRLRRRIWDPREVSLQMDNFQQRGVRSESPGPRVFSRVPVIKIVLRSRSIVRESRREHELVGLIMIVGPSSTHKNT